MKKYVALFVVLLICITLGNRIYNHFHAWVGLAFIPAVRQDARDYTGSMVAGNSQPCRRFDSASPPHKQK